MSKAFTRESDEPPDESFSIRPTLPPGVQNLITPEGAERLRQQVAELTEQKGRAQSNSSSASNNTGFDLRQLEARIKQLQQTLATVVVSQPLTRNPGKILFGSIVTVRQSNGDEFTYRIVGIDEIDLNKGYISWRSPLARAMLSKQVGEEIQFDSPSGTQRLRIIALK